MLTGHLIPQCGSESMRTLHNEGCTVYSHFQLCRACIAAAAFRSEFDGLGKISNVQSWMFGAFDIWSCKENLPS